MAQQVYWIRLVFQEIEWKAFKFASYNASYKSVLMFGASDVNHEMRDVFYSLHPILLALNETYIMKGTRSKTSWISTFSRQEI